MKILYHFFAWISMIKLFFQIKIFQKRFRTIEKSGKKFRPVIKNDKVLIVIVHMVPDAEIALEDKLFRLLACLESLEKSMALINHEIIILTKEKFTLHRKLPQYLIDKVEILFSSQLDPMYVEFDAYNIFESAKDEFDYFIFLEDDILLSDSWFLEKIKKFNALSPYKHFLLQPHRFEYFKGVKHYLDQTTVRIDKQTIFNYADFLKVDLFDNVSLCVYQNPHSGFYCLSKEQLYIWIKSGNKWKNQVVAFGILESAATFCLYENFQFLSPHPNSLGYFEVQHYGNKYILNDKIVDQEIE